MPKRVVKKIAGSGRCRWCGKMVRFVPGPRGTCLAKHKTVMEYEYRDDDLCPGSGLLKKRIPQRAIETHPQAVAKKRKKRVKRVKR